MISAEAPILFAKACELFIMDITFRALLHTNMSKRKTLQKSDISATIGQNEMFDFLIDIIPREETDKEFLAKRESERQNFSNYKVMPKFPETNTFMKHPLYSSNPNQMGQKQVVPRQITQQDNVVDPMDIDNYEKQSTMSYGMFSTQNKNKSFLHN